MKILRLFCVVSILSTSFATAAQEPREPKAGDQFTYDLGPVNDGHEIVSVTATEIGVKSTVFGNVKMPRSVSGPWSWTGGRFTGRYEEQYFGAAPSVMPPEIGKSVSASGT